MNPTPTGVTADTLAAVALALSSPGAVSASDAILQKATTQGISTSTNLVGYLLEGPAKNLFPVLSPLRNRFSRMGAPVGATAVNWKAITVINAAKLKAGVAEGVRNAVVSTTEVDKVQSFKDFGLDDSVTFRAVDAGRGFEDVRSMSTANLLSAVMVEEEKLILGGSVTAITSPAVIAHVDSVTVGALVASTTYDIAVSALTSYGYLNGATGRAGADSADETTATLVSHTTAVAKTAIDISWGAVRGASAYNVFIGASAGTKFYVATVTAPFFTLTALIGSGNTINVANQTADALSFDGLIPQIEVAGSGAYWKDLANTTMTGDNAGGIVEFDALLQSLYDVNRISPTAVFTNSQQGRDMLAKVAANGATTTLRFNAVVDPSGIIRGGLKLGSYLNKFTGQEIDVITHPYLAPGKIIAISERLPYPNNNVPNPFEVEVLREYTQYDWALAQRKYEFGVYGTEALKVYFPGGCGVLTGIKAG